MLVLAVVRGPQQRQIRLAAADRFEVMVAETWKTAIGIMLKHLVAVCVVDPALSGRTRVEDVEHLRRLFPSVPFVVYTPITAVTASVLLKLGITDVVIAGIDDHPAILADRLLAVAAAAESEMHSSRARR